MAEEEIRYIFVAEGLDDLDGRLADLQARFGDAKGEAEDASGALDGLGGDADIAARAIEGLAGKRGIRSLSSALAVVNPKLGKAGRLISAITRVGPAAGAAIGVVAVAAGGLYLEQQRLEAQLEAANEEMERQARIAGRMANVTDELKVVTQAAAQEYAIFTGETSSAQLAYEAQIEAINAAAAATKDEIRANQDNIELRNQLLDGIERQRQAAVNQTTAVFKAGEADKAAAKAAQDKAEADAKAAQARAARERLEAEAAAQETKRLQLLDGLQQSIIDNRSDMLTSSERLTLQYNEQADAITQAAEAARQLGADELDLEIVQDALIANQQRYYREIGAGIQELQDSAKVIEEDVLTSIDDALAEHRSGIVDGASTATGAVTDIMRNAGSIIGREGGKNALIQFRINQGAAIADATVATLRASTQALPNIPLAALIGAAGASNVAAIAAQQPPQTQAHMGGQLAAPGARAPDERDVSIRTLRHEMGVGIVNSAGLNALNSSQVPYDRSPPPVLSRNLYDRMGSRQARNNTSSFSKDIKRQGRRSTRGTGW